MTHAAPTPDESVPIPPRYWWLKRILVSCAVLLVLLLALRLWWGWEAHRRLQAEIDRIIAAGEPIHPEDFDPTEVIPDEQNAAKLLQAAAHAVTLSPDQDGFLEGFRGSSLADEQLVQAGTILESNAAVFELLRRARHAPEVNWEIRLRSPIVFNYSPSLAEYRQLSRLLSLSIRYHVSIGDHAEAVEKMRDSLALGEALEAMPGLLPILVAMAIDWTVADSVEALGSRLNVHKPGDSFDAETGSCPRAAMEEFLHELLDDRPCREAFRRAMLFERVSYFDMVRGVTNGSLPPPIARTRAYPWTRAYDFAISPLLEMEGVTMLRDGELRLRAASETSWPAAVRLLPKELSDDDVIGALAHFISRIALASLERSFLIHYRRLAHRQLAATALAIRLYEVDTGQRPTTVQDLVPMYLSYVPVDPFAADDAPIRYQRERALLYCVGPDGRDDGGRFAFRRSGTAIDPDKLDFVFFLDGNRPKSAAGASALPSAETAGQN